MFPWLDPFPVAYLRVWLSSSTLLVSKDLRDATGDAPLAINRGAMHVTAITGAYKYESPDICNHHFLLERKK
jgi:hypothetical protein